MKYFTFLLVIILLSGLNVLAQPFNTQEQWEQYFKTKIKDLDPIEGIWSQSFTFKVFDKYNSLRQSKFVPQDATIVIYKVGDKFKTYDISPNLENSNTGTTFINTATAGIYLMELYYRKSYSTAKANAVLTGSGLLEFSYDVPTAQTKYKLGDEYIEGVQITFEHQWIKIFPGKLDYKEHQPTSGTGFAISSNGIIVTNFHVIDGAKTIKVRGVNSDFNKTFNAKILISDKNNDLTLIQIDDYGFTSLEIIPYTIKTSLADVGENIFVLGYPLRATMGDEIKLTNGIISSRTGFQGDITSYQISAPVQPGNSGGPLFDNQGNLIGIINAKHVGAENASYAVKSNYLMNLIELIPSPPKLQTIDTLSGKTLPDQVEMIKQFVYIIEVE
jgi:S1-C subfamily serine protease